MDNFMKKMAQYDLLRGVVLGLLGIIVLWKPGMIFNGIVYIIAVYFAFMGILNLYTVIREKAAFAGAYASGIFLLLAALAVIVLAKPIVSFIPLLLGLFVLIGGIRQLLQEIQLHHQGSARIGWLVFSILLMAAGALLVFNPFESVLLMFRIFGGILVATAIAAIISYFQQKNM